MQTFDTLKIKVPAEAIHYRDDTFFEHTHKEKAGKIIHTSLPKVLPIGIGSISQTEGEGYIIEASAKVLRDNYLDGISINNIDQLFIALKPVLDIDMSLAVSSAQVLKCDTTNNLLLSEIGVKNQTEVNNALYAGKANDRFNTVLNNTKHNQGIVFQGTQQEKNRLICYDKSLDLLKNDNKHFMASLTNAGRVYNRALGITRVEVNHTSFDAIKDRLGIETNTLSEILTSSKPTNHNFLRKVLKVQEHKQLTIYDRILDYLNDGKDGAETENDIGRRTIIEQCNYDETLLKAIYRELYPNRNLFNYHWHRSDRAIKKKLEHLKNSRNTEQLQMTQTVCNRLLEQLRIAV